jgi:hypothetical protein
MTSRQGSLLEKNVWKLLKLAGFEPELNKIFKGYEIDVFLKYSNMKIGFECKQYERSNLGVRNLIHQWDSKNKELNLNKIILVITGVNISNKEHQLAKKSNMIIWDEKKVDYLFNKAIEEKAKIKKEIIKEMELSLKEITEEKVVEDDEDKIIIKIKEEIGKLSEKNSGKSVQGGTTCHVYPIVLSINNSFQIQYAIKGGIRLMDFSTELRYLSFLKDFLHQFNFQETNLKCPREGEYHVDSIGIIVSFGEDINLISKFIAKVLIQLDKVKKKEDLKFKWLGGGPCFIATAVYGTPLAEEIDVLRFWRDETLLQNSFGKHFVKGYYDFSPSIANFIQKKDYLKTSIRLFLNPFVKLLRKKNSNYS